MSRFTKSIRLAACTAVLSGVFVGVAFAQSSKGGFAGIGRAATPAEIKAWDIDVRPDFKGLPAGSGSVAKGQDVWEAKCASCHGVFGESTEVFTPIVGGTTKKDIETGRVANLSRLDFPQRTTLMKVATVSTLWDYINRAMPWNNPKTLTTEEVYAVVAYILSLGEIVPDNFVLSDKNIAEVQQRMPNRNGMTEKHGLWDIKGKPDVMNTICMKDCATELKIASSLPDSARDAHGNLKEQYRPIGPARAIDTSKPGAAPGPASAAPAATTVAAASVNPAEIAKKNNCTTCHAPATKLVGPSWAEIAKKYKGDAKAAGLLATKVKNGGAGVWGPVPMPPHPNMKDNELSAVVQWVLDGAK
ncbi:MAG: c-type cytochrome [Burkholderiaceae bacterium]|nr:c-type cytochrome [Burkholderiaceae bacterium]